MPALNAVPAAFAAVRARLARGLCGVLLAAVALGAAAPAAAAADPPKGAAVPIGGALRPDTADVWTRLVGLAGGRGARFVVLGTASQDPIGSAAEAVRDLGRYGAQAEALPVSPLIEGSDAAAAARDPALVAKVRAARGVYFTGGAQERIVDTLLPQGKPTPLLEAIWAVYRAGGVVAGTSAGAAIMSTVMFRDAPDVLAVLQGRWQDGREVGTGLGFVGPDLFVDQHFLKRGRFGRMIPVMQAKGYRLGLGIDENSAAVVQGGTIEVLGGSGALLVDLSGARSRADLAVFNLEGIRLTYLDHGDRYDLRTRTLQPSEQKLRGQLLDPAAAGYKPYYTEQPFHVDMLGDSVLSRAMGFLMDSSQTELHGLALDPRPEADGLLADLGFSFRLYKGAGSRAWTTDANGPDEYSVADLYLDILPVRIARPLATPWTAARTDAAARSPEPTHGAPP